MPQQFFYDEQIRRFLLQFIRAFSNFQVEYGKDRDGNTTLQTVPVKYGDSTRMVSSIIRENSENKIMPTPMIEKHGRKYPSVGWLSENQLFVAGKIR